MSKFKKKVKQNRKFDKAVITNFFFYVLKDMLYASKLYFDYINNQNNVIDINMNSTGYKVL